MPTKARLALFLQGTSQTRIARKAKCDVAYVNRCVNGKQKPSARLIKAMCEVTGLKEEDLFEVSVK